MSIIHKDLQHRWKDLSFAEQMANVGSEVERALNWKEKGNEEYCKLAFFRALELLGFTIAEAKGYPKLKELCRTREALIDYFCFDNVYGSTAKSWRNYFYCFTYQARVAGK